MREETEEVSNSQIMEDFVCLNNKECAPYHIKDMELLKGFKPQIEMITVAGVWMMV